jgi:hypothetical protein
MKSSERSSTNGIRDSMRSPMAKREPHSSPVFFRSRLAADFLSFLITVAFLCRFINDQMGPCDSEPKRGDDVRSEDDESVMQILQYKSEDEPDGEVIPANQPMQVVAAVSVIPGGSAYGAPQYPPGGIFDTPDAYNVGQPARHPWHSAHSVAQRLEQERGQSVERKTPQVRMTFQPPVSLPPQPCLFDCRPKHFPAPSQKTVKKKSCEYHIRYMQEVV